MLFSSVEFFVFFAIYFLFHLALPDPFRVYLIICGSTVFYAWWKLEYVWLPYLLMGIAYFGARWMDRAGVDAGRKRRAILTIAVLFLPLVFFKYTDFLYRDVLGPITGANAPMLGLSLPLGVSFVTFTLTAYVVDIYRKKFPNGSSLRAVSAYVLFFPHLIAGPILRPDELIPQIEQPKRKLAFGIIAGLAIFTLGLVKKVVFADQIGLIVDAVYSGTTTPTVLDSLAALYGFSVQIYCDFSGYTDMAIGLALLLSVRLPNNFSRPYGAMSIVDFWRRWHITLSFWLRDYLYIPLGGNRGGPFYEARNIIVTMVLGGLWHGANWTFVLWGLAHGVAVAFVHGLRRSRISDAVSALPPFIATLITFHFVTLVWVLFRAPTVHDAARVAGGLFSGRLGEPQAVFQANAFGILLMVLFFALHRFDDHRRVKWLLRRARPEIVWSIIAALWILAITVSQGSSAKFIYFDF